MTRIQQSKLFLSVLVIASIAFVGANFHFLGVAKGLAALLAVEIFIIWHNRKQKEHLKDFNNGRKLMKKGRYNEAISQFLFYLKYIKDHPEKEKTTVLNFGLYTHSSVAMAYNNIGACCIELGYYKKAMESLERAIEVDTDYAIPYYNMAIVASVWKDDERVNHCVERMTSLGYKATLEEVFQKISQLPEEVVEIDEIE